MEMSLSSMRTCREILKQVLLLMMAGAARRALAQGVPQVQSRRLSVPLVDASGKVVSRYNASSKYMLEDLGAGVSLEVALIPGGLRSRDNDPVSLRGKDQPGRCQLQRRIHAPDRPHASGGEASAQPVRIE